VPFQFLGPDKHCKEIEGRSKKSHYHLGKMPVLANSLNGDLPLAQVLQTGGAATSITPMVQETTINNEGVNLKLKT
jgi:hypothetical protein